MGVLLISYDLNGHERPESYAKIKDKIEKGATSSYKLLYSQWLVETDDTPHRWVEFLSASLDGDDRMLVTRVSSDWSGWLSQQERTWLRERM